MANDGLPPPVTPPQHVWVDESRLLKLEEALIRHGFRLDDHELHTTRRIGELQTELVELAAVKFGLLRRDMSLMLDGVKTTGDAVRQELKTEVTRVEHRLSNIEKLLAMLVEQGRTHS